MGGASLARHGIDAPGFTAGVFIMSGGGVMSRTASRMRLSRHRDRQLDVAARRMPAQATHRRISFQGACA